MPTLTPPTKLTFLIAFAFFVVGLIVQLGVVTGIPGPSAGYFIVAYLVMMFGNLIRGI